MLSPYSSGSLKTPYYETHTQQLQRKAKRVGHYAMARWMMKNGYLFRYAYYVIFNKFPKQSIRADEHKEATR